ncbi:MAG: CoA transferase [Dehalococcoidia bacterium]|nr:CoA transferase [Dehalococcoidia bacterium]MDW8120300.1 CoA transferase [Chloroflexota bacterium]
MGALPLEGIKVADFSWVGVGPVTIKYLADHGATVVHIESLTHPDVLRLAPPFKDREVGINRSGFFANYNASKYGVSLNLAHPRGRDLARRLIAWADVVAESFTPGVMAKFGLDYASVRQWKPDVIYFSTCQLGQDGPWARQPGYGVQLSAFSGFYHLARWPDRAPAGPYGAYTDFINPRFGAFAILAALEYRRRTGQGQYIDLSQLEGGIQFLGPLLMDYLNNGHDPEPQGNRDPLACPHGAFPAQGTDRWVVIACFTDAHWEGLVRAMGSPSWATDPSYATFLGRKAHEDALEQRLAQWTRQYDAYALMTLLQSYGVPCGVVQSQEDLFRDPQLAHRGHFVRLRHTEIGDHHYDGIPFRLSRTPGYLRKAAPCLGEDNAFVFTHLLGISQEEYEAYKAEGALA